MAKIETIIRDSRKHPFFWIDKRLVQRDGAVLGANAIAVYNVLASYADGDSQQAFPGIKRISKLLGGGKDGKGGLSASTVQEAIKHLEANGWIAIERHRDEDGRNMSNIYTLLEPPMTAAGIPPQRRHPGTAAGMNQEEVVENNDSYAASGGLPEKTNGADTPPDNTGLQEGETRVYGGGKPVFTRTIIKPSGNHQYGRSAKQEANDAIFDVILEGSFDGAPRESVKKRVGMATSKVRAAYPTLTPDDLAEFYRSFKVAHARDGRIVSRDGEKLVTDIAGWLKTRKPAKVSDTSDNSNYTPEPTAEDAGAALDILTRRSA